MDTINNVITAMELVGIPSIFAIVLWLAKKSKTFAEKLIILQRAQKAQMRSQLLKQYYDYCADGYISADDLDDWVNQYNEYHKLVGNNEVLEARRNSLISMPNTKPIPAGRKTNEVKQ